MLNILINKKTRFISCIEVPGKIEGSGRSVVEALGGLSTLKRTLGQDDLETNHVSGCTSKSINSQVVLRCCVKDRYSSLLSSTVQKRNDILIKCRRDKHTKRIVSFELIGVIIEKRSFNLMADFYCIPPNGPRSSMFNIDYELKENAAEPLFVPPPAFSHIVNPYPYLLDPTFSNVSKDATLKRFKKKNEESNSFPILVENKKKLLQLSDSLNNPKETFSSQTIPKVGTHAKTHHFEEPFDLVEEIVSDQTSDSLNSYSPHTPNARTYSESLHTSPSSKSVNTSTKFLNSKMMNATCAFSAFQIPTSPAIGTLDVNVDADLLRSVEQFFKDRPIWIRSFIDLLLLPDIVSWKKKPLLGRCCYIFKDGPWRGAYCRLGYDPRQHPESRIYQTIDFRDAHFRSISWKFNLSKTLKKQSEARQTSPSSFFSQPKESEKITLEHITFKLPPSRPNQLYQLCDIADPCIQEVLNTAVPLETCCKVSGWLPQETLTKIRGLMLLVSKQMRGSTQLS